MPSSRPRVGPIYARPKNPKDPTRRTVITDTSVAIYGWPSRGGVIILEEATHVDFGFLGLSTTDPPLKRDRGHHDGSDGNGEDAKAVAAKIEDAFCQRLLLLGAKWWDSEARYRFVGRVGAGIQPAIEEVEDGRVEEPTVRERRWVRVGWEGAPASSSIPGDADVAAGCRDGNGTGTSSLWVLDCDTNMHGILEVENMVPVDAGRVGLARSMEERCTILKGMGARFLGSVKEDEGRTTFLRAWEWKFKGEIGELAKVN